MTGPQRTCTMCQGPLVQRDNETNARFVHRIYCGRACAGQARRGAVPHNKGEPAKAVPQTGKVCPHCKTPMVPRETDSQEAFGKRMFCGQKCSRAANKFVLRTLPERF